MLSKNLVKLRKQLNLNQNDFALKLGIVPRAYVNYERGERKLPIEIIEKLCKELKVNLNWLIADVGDMFMPTEYNAAKNELRSEVLQILKDEGIIK